MTPFEQAYAFTLKQEGVDVEQGDSGYTVDSGGPTKWGVSQRAYPHLDIAALTLEEAETIYQRDYWTPAHCPEIADSGKPQLALCHFDAAFNMGVGQAARILQRAVGVAVDGIIGPATLAAVTAADETDAINRYLDERARAYRAIAALRPSEAVYLHGWLARCRAVARATGAQIAASFALEA